jgi:pentatricopeptide repeat protein
MSYYAENAFVTTALVTMYAKCGAMLEAEAVFGSAYDRDLAMWNAMLTACIEQGRGERALELYAEMQKLGVCIDEITFTCCMQGCAETGCLEVCKQLHFGILGAGFDRSVHTIAASLINAYGDCASMPDAQAFFDALSEPDHVTWTASISGHAWHGSSVSSLRMFEKLSLAGLEADEILLTTVLTACSHAGLVSEGLGCFASLCCTCRISPNLKHYGILLDLLGRAGDFKRAENALEKMPMKPDASIWLSLLGICQTHGCVEFARRAFLHVIRLRPSETYAYVLMSNIFEADAQRLKQDDGCEA